MRMYNPFKRKKPEPKLYEPGETIDLTCQRHSYRAGVCKHCGRKR